MTDEREVKARQLRIKGIDGEEAEGEKRGEGKKEAESKLWVLIVLALSVLMSLLFSLRAESGWREKVFGRRDGGESQEVRQGGLKEEGWGWFGPAVYEFE